MAFSPDGKRIASASNDQTVKVWDAQTGQDSLTLRGLTSYVTSVAFSPDGKRVSARDDKCVWKTWDPVTGRGLPPLPLPAARESQSVLGPDHRLRAIAADTVVYLVDTQPSDERRAELQAFWRHDPAWHEEQLRQAEAERNWFAAAFHADQLVRLRPNEAALLNRRDRCRRLLEEERRRFGVSPGRIEPDRAI